MVKSWERVNIWIFGAQREREHLNLPRRDAFSWLFMEKSATFWPHGRYLRLYLNLEMRLNAQTQQMQKCHVWSFPSPVQTGIRQTPFIGFSYSFCSVLNSSRVILSPQENLCETFDHSWKAFKPNYWDHIWMDFETQSTLGTYSKFCF